MSLVLEKELENLKVYEKDFDYFDDIYDELYEKYKNEFVAIKNRVIYYDQDLDNLLDILKKNQIDPSHTFIEFVKDKNIRYI